MKKYILDNLPTIWVIAVFVLGMALAANHANANENKSITPKEFATTISEVPGKVGNWFTGEVEKTKAYQTKVWSEAKTKWPWTMLKGKNNASQN